MNGALLFETLGKNGVLESLRLGDGYELDQNATEAISLLKEVRDCEMGSTRGQGDIAASLAKLPRLTQLELSEENPARWPRIGESLSKMIELRTLHIARIELEESDLKALASLSKLNKVEFRGRISESAIKGFLITRSSKAVLTQHKLGDYSASKEYRIKDGHLECQVLPDEITKLTGTNSP